MIEEEYGEQNIDIDEFLKNASDKLSKNDDESKNIITQILSNYFLSIINDQEQCAQFFILVNSTIFPNYSNSHSPNNISQKKNIDIEGFRLYPLIYSFNPKLSVNYINYFLSSLMQAATEENKSNFSFLSSIFADIINIYYNNNDIEIHKLLDNEQKQKLYQKFFDFINNNIKTNKRIEQSLGFLLLNELIEKCPLVKEHKHLALLFKEISRYLDDRWFKCKLDLLNCIISLIFKVGEQFKPYANVCLFRILDNLTDSDWMKRKLAINIVYTLVFYCKKEMMAVKENIIEFLNILKEDEVAEVREVCMQTLKFIEESDNKGKNNNNNNDDFSDDSLNEKKNEKSNEKSNEKNIEKNNEKNKTNYNSDFNNIFDKNKYIRNINNYFDNGLYLYNLIKDQSTPKNYSNNNSNSLQNIKKVKNNRNNRNENDNFKKGSSSIGALENSSINTYKDKDYIINLKSATNMNKTNKNKAKINTNNIRNINNINSPYNNNTEVSEEKMSQKLNISSGKDSLYNLSRKSNKNNFTKKLVKHNTNRQFKTKFNKDKILLKDFEKQLNERKAIQSQISSYSNQNMTKRTIKFSNSKIKNNKINIYDNEIKKEISQSEKNNSSNKEMKKNSYINDLINNNINNNNNKTKIKQDFTMDKILEQLNNIQESQNDLIKMINNLKNTVDKNYCNLDKRISKLEKYHKDSLNNININEDNQINNDELLNENNVQNQIIDDEMKIEIIKNKFISGKYNEAVTEAKENDKYLYRLLPLILSENIPKIDLSIIEDIISELILKLPKLCMGEGKNNIIIILSFFNQVIRSRIHLKLIIQMNLKDTLQLMKTEYNLQMSQNDLANIDIILRSLKI